MCKPLYILIIHKYEQVIAFLIVPSHFNSNNILIPSFWKTKKWEDIIMNNINSVIKVKCNIQQPEIEPLINQLDEQMPMK